MGNLKEKIKDIAVVILSIFLLVMIISTFIDINQKLQQTDNTITVSETGEIYTSPDLVLVNFSVVVEAKTVGQALSQNASKMNAIIEFMKEEGIEEKDLKTVGLNLYPRYEWPERTQFVSGERVLVGYEARQSLEVKIRDLEKISAIIEGGTVAGANEVGNLQFIVDQQEEFKKQARQEAIAKAKAKAEELAEQLGVKLVRITNFQESSFAPYYSYGLKEEAAMGMGGSDFSPQIQTGESKIEVQVFLTYEIN